MANDPKETYEFLSRAYKIVKIIAASIVSVAVALASIIAFNLKVGKWWVDIQLPLYSVAIIFSALFIAFGVLSVAITLWLRDGLGALSFFKNKSENFESMVSQLEKIAFNDPITGIPNSYALKGEIAKGNKAGRVCRCLVLLDLQNFGQLNKKFNHWFGDEYLRNFADLVINTSRRNEFLFKKRPDGQTEIRSEGTLGSVEGVTAFRKNSGGDEFYILLEGTLIDGLGYLNRLQRRAEEFEEMSVRVLQAKHKFGFQAGLIAIGKDEEFESADKRVSQCLGLAMDRDYPLSLYWNDKELPKMAPNSFEEKILCDVRKLFSKKHSKD